MRNLLPREVGADLLGQRAQQILDKLQPAAIADLITTAARSARRETAGVT